MVFFQNPYVNGAFIGLTSTIVMTVFLFFARIFVKDAKLNLFLMLGGRFSHAFQLKVKENVQMVLGLAEHLIIGSFFGLLYYIGGIMVYYSLGIFTGMVFAILPWLAMMVAVMPFLGKGSWGKKLGKRAPFMTFILHMVYGFVLGYLAGM